MDYNRLILQFDRLVNIEDFNGAGRLLEESKHNLADDEIDILLAINNELIGFYRKQNDEINCLRVINETLTSLFAITDKKTEFYGTIYINIATGYSAFNYILDAEKNFKIAEQIYDAVLDKYDTKFSALYNNFASIYLAKNELVLARHYYKLAISIAENNGNKLQKAQSLINMTYTYDSVNDEQIIADLLDDALDILYDEDIVKDMEYSFILKKYSQDFGYYGYFLVEEELKNIAKEIDERYRISERIL